MRERTLFSRSVAKACLAITVLAGCAIVPTSALASSGNLATTQAYVQANYALVHVAITHLATSEAAPLAVLAQVRSECPRAGAESPQDPESTQLSDEVIGAMVIGAIRPDRQAMTTFIGAATRLSWSNRRLTSAVRAYAGDLKTVLGLSAPDLCGDVKAWAASGFHALPASTVAFVGKFMPAWVALGFLPAQLTPYESSTVKSLARRGNQLQEHLAEGEARAVENWGAIMNALVLNP